MYEMICRIRFSETDQSGRLSMNGLLRLFQDCGYCHAQDRALGLEFTERTHCTWYLLSWKIHALRLPMVGEQVVIRTCIYDMQASIARKSIAMYDRAGSCLALGDTMWVYMNVERQEPAIPEKGCWLSEDFGEEIRLPLQEDMQSGVIRTAGWSARRIAIPKELKPLSEYPVEPYLLDTNGHANNVRLTELAMRMCCADAGCYYLRAEFKQQVKAGSMIRPYLSGERGSTVVVFRDEREQNLAVFEFA